MKIQFNQIVLFSLVFIFSNCQRTAETVPFESCWNVQPDRIWTGPEYWANRLQDWQIENGKLECINGNEPKRTLHLLTHYLTERPGSLQMQAGVGLLKKIYSEEENVYCGFLICAGSVDMDYRRRAIIHGTHGNKGGLIAALNIKGDLVLINNETNDILARADNKTIMPPGHLSETRLSLKLIPKGEEYEIIITSGAKKGEVEYNSLHKTVNKSLVKGGNLALIVNGGQYKFEDWTVRGTKVKYEEGNQLGPIIGIQYTISENVLKLTAQLPPLSESDEPEVELQTRNIETGKWTKIAASQIRTPGYTAGFKLRDWNSSVSHEYRIVYPVLNKKSQRIPYYYNGIIVSDPVEKEEIVAAAFTGNSNSHGNIGRYAYDFEQIWFPHEDITSYVKKHNPDILIYTGDNVYEGRPTAPDYSSEVNTGLDYLYKWYMFLWAHGNLTRNIPAITIPDDHDVYHGNVWGANGVAAPAVPKNREYPAYYSGLSGHWQQDQGGYKLSPELVNMIQRTQTSHLPDPYDQEPVEQGIDVYFCDLNYGRISWAVLEDRKFKSAPGKIHPQYRIINGFSQIKGINGRQLDSPDATLLGDRQLAFISDWAADWEGVDMKVAISQSIFANLSTYPDTFLTDAQTPRLQPLPLGEIPKDYSKAKDMDSNGWPQTGRNKALRELRKGFAVMIGGDQHLGSVIHHGIDNWEDAGYSFCVPSIANLWPRRWFPPVPGENHQESMPLYTGRYFDGFGNKISVHAVSNPYISGKEPAVLHDRAPGYGIVKIIKSTQDITFECWPRYSDPGSFNSEQYPGWPITINMLDNYGKKPSVWLPPIRVTGLEHPPVIQVIDEITGETIFTLRSRGFKYQPGVFHPGTYSVIVGEPGTKNTNTLGGLVSAADSDQDEILVEF
jgi:alkaline phosphatase D